MFPSKQATSKKGKVMYHSENDTNLIIVDDESSEEAIQPRPVTVNINQNNPASRSTMIKRQIDEEIRHKLPIMPLPTPPKYSPKGKVRTFEKFTETNVAYISDPVEMSLVTFIRQINIDPVDVLKILKEYILDQTLKCGSLTAKDIAGKIAELHSERNKKILLNSLYNSGLVENKEQQPKEVSVPEETDQETTNLSKMDVMYKMVKDLHENRGTKRTSISTQTQNSVINDKRAKIYKSLKNISAAQATVMPNLPAEVSQRSYNNANWYGHQNQRMKQHTAGPSVNPLQGRFNNYDMGSEESTSYSNLPSPLNPDRVNRQVSPIDPAMPSSCMIPVQQYLPESVAHINRMPLAQNASLHENRAGLTVSQYPGAIGSPTGQLHNNLNYYKMQEWHSMQNDRQQGLRGQGQHYSTYVSNYNYPNTQWSNYQRKA